MSDLLGRSVYFFFLNLKQVYEAQQVDLNLSQSEISKAGFRGLHLSILCLKGEVIFISSYTMMS